MSHTHPGSNVSIFLMQITKKSFLIILLACPLLATAEERPSLLFREDWKEIPQSLPVNQEHVANEDLVLHLHGPAKEFIKKSHHDTPLDDPYYIWSGPCESGNWAVSLESKKGVFNLSGKSKVRWRTKQHGFRTLRIIIELDSGTWLVSDQGDDASNDWRIKEFNIADIEWRNLNIDTVTEEHPIIENPDLTKIRRIGFTDLMIGGRSKACSRLDWIEVYAFPSE